MRFVQQAQRLGAVSETAAAGFAGFVVDEQRDVHTCSSGRRESRPGVQAQENRAESELVPSRGGSR